MDTFNKLSTAGKVVLGGTVAFLIVSFFDWFSVNDLGGVSMWEGIGTLAGILAVALLVWEGLQLANVKVSLPISHAMASTLVALLIAVIAIIRFIDKPGGGVVADAFDRTIWAWLGIALAIVIAGAAFMRMQEGGESFADMRSSVTSAASGAAAKAREAVDRDDTPSSPPPASSTTDDTSDDSTRI